ncbi:MAG TPA: hypothetical protein VGO21_00130, partial [Candidatus Paceibacterota bacterium]|nr:hypothetical protein [Candidatus Paceibacterota bacterium]
MDERLKQFKKNFPEIAKNMKHISVEVTKVPTEIPDYVKEALIGARFLATEVNSGAYGFNEETGERFPITDETYMVDK